MNVNFFLGDSISCGLSAFSFWTPVAIEQDCRYRKQSVLDECVLTRADSFEKKVTHKIPSDKSVFVALLSSKKRIKWEHSKTNSSLGILISLFYIYDFTCNPQHSSGFHDSHVVIVSKKLKTCLTKCSIFLHREKRQDLPSSEPDTAFFPQLIETKIYFLRMHTIIWSLSLIK